MNINSQNTNKILAIISFICIFVATLIILKTPTVTGYEISIYDAYSPVFWFFIIVAMFIGVITIFLSANNGDKTWLLGSLAIINSSMILLLLPLIRNYLVLGREDALSHFGLMTNILKTGFIGENMYPMEHILGVITYFLSGISINLIIMVFPSIFYVLYVMSSYLVFDYLLNDKRKILICLVFTLIPLFGTSNTLFAPFTQSVLFIPFFIYCFMKSRDSSHKILFTILTILLSFFVVFLHPLTIVITCLIVFIFHLSRKIQFKIKPLSKNILINPYTLITMIVVVFLSWQAYALIVLKNFNRVYDWLFLNEGISQVQSYVNAASYADLTLQESIKYIIYNYGQFIILGIIAGVSVLFILKKFFKNRERINFYEIFSSLGFLIFLMWALSMMFIIHLFGWLRVYVISIIFAILLVPVFIDLVLKKSRNLSFKRIKCLTLGLLLFSTIYFSVFNLYPSPVIEQDGSQVSAAEMIGMETFFNNRNQSILIKEIGLSQWRFNDAINGHRDFILNISTNSSTLRIQKKQTDPPVHFGYDVNESIGDVYSNKYLLLNNLAKEHYPVLFPEFKDKWRYTPDDFTKLNEDRAAQFIYSNGNLEIFFIGGK